MSEDVKTMTAKNDDAMQTSAVEGTQKSETGQVSPLKHFLREVMAELKKTNWPTRNELVKYTVVVVMTIVIVAVYLYLADLVIGQISSNLFQVGDAARNAGR